MDKGTMPAGDPVMILPRTSAWLQCCRQCSHCTVGSTAAAVHSGLIGPRTQVEGGSKQGAAPG